MKVLYKRSHTIKASKSIRFVSSSGQLYIISVKLALIPIIVVCIMTLALISSIKAYNIESNRVNKYMSVVKDKDTKINEQITKYNKLIVEFKGLEKMIDNAEQSLNILKEQEEEVK